ncbi:conserved hypothetical protein [Candidatus Sulfopaludibacter sp. SbA6]|nr:conserved hypothetical protein [Candidatus Sulfopaludibacter sp. SbA6]
MPSAFLTAEWRYLAMLNYAVDPALLEPLVPSGTELDRFDGTAYISLVGFRFLRTKVRGIRVPFHSDFDEVNLRFYVRPKRSGPVRRGVVFIREIVPRFAVAKVARAAFHENYIALPMRHQIAEPVSEDGRVQAEYRWRHAGTWNSLRVESAGRPVPAAEGSLEQFITEHYWGYAAQPGGGCLEYQVAHERWRVWKANAAKFAGDPSGLYGPRMAACLNREPDSAFLADGSVVTVYSGAPIA